MILGLSSHPAAACFTEIDEAVRQLRGKDDVCFNAHAFPADVPPDAVVFQTENVPGQVANPAALWPDHEIWDLSRRNAEQYGGRHVPVGYHPSFERFKRADVLDIDVVFTGCLNERRIAVLQALADRGLSVTAIPPGVYGAERDAVLARAKLALSMLYYSDGVFPALRVAHLVANRVPVLSERCVDGWDYIPSVAIDMVEWCARNAITEGPAMAEHAYQRFRQTPMRLPS